MRSCPWAEPAPFAGLVASQRALVRSPEAQALPTGSASPASQGDLQSLGLPPLWPLFNTAGASQKGLEPGGGGYSSRFVKNTVVSRQKLVVSPKNLQQEEATTGRF